MAVCVCRTLERPRPWGARRQNGWGQPLPKPPQAARRSSASPGRRPWRRPHPCPPLRRAPPPGQVLSGAATRAPNLGTSRWPCHLTDGRGGEDEQPGAAEVTYTPLAPVHAHGSSRVTPATGRGAFDWRDERMTWRGQRVNVCVGHCVFASWPGAVFDAHAPRASPSVPTSPQEGADPGVDPVQGARVLLAAPGPGQGAVPRQAGPALLHGDRLVRPDELHRSGGRGSWHVFPCHNGIAATRPVRSSGHGHGAGRRRPRRRRRRRDGGSHGWGSSRRHHPQRRDGAHAWGRPVQLLLLLRHPIRRRHAVWRRVALGRRWPPVPRHAV